MPPLLLPCSSCSSLLRPVAAQSSWQLGHNHLGRKQIGSREGERMRRRSSEMLTVPCTSWSSSHVRTVMSEHLDDQTVKVVISEKVGSSAEVLLFRTFGNSPGRPGKELMIFSQPLESKALLALMMSRFRPSNVQVCLSNEPRSEWKRSEGKFFWARGWSSRAMTSCI